MGLLDVFKKNTPKVENAPSTDHKIVILIVEDEQFLREFYQELLTQEGYKIITAKNGQEGLVAATENKPSLILLDIMMPVMDGMKMFKTLRAGNMHTPVIFLTNAGNINNVKEAMTYGDASGFLIKSNVTPEEVISKVKEALLDI